MSMMIESTDELLLLLKKMDLKVNSVDDLQQLLATINANYNPDAVRQRTGKLIGVTVPGYMAGAAAFTSWLALGGGITRFTIGALALIWGPCALVCIVSVIAGAVMTSVRRGRATPDYAFGKPASRSEAVVTHVTTGPRSG